MKKRETAKDTDTSYKPLEKRDPGHSVKSWRDLGGLNKR
jgi:hypothetical protein